MDLLALKTFQGQEPLLAYGLPVLGKAGVNPFSFFTPVRRPAPEASLPQTGRPQASYNLLR